jgi:biotin carboxylase
MADKSYVADILNKEAVLVIAQTENVDGVIHSSSEVAMHTMGYINDMMNLSGIGLETAIRATNKQIMRRAFEAAGAPSPVSKSATSLAEGLLMTKEIEGDIIVKPSRNSGSRGVTRLPQFPTENEIIDAFNRAIENSHDPSVMIEQYIEGPEFSVEIVIWNNKPRVLTVTDKLTSGNPYFVELGHSQPSQFSLQDQKIIKDAAISGCKALGLDWCAAHAEIKLKNKKPYIVEIGGRLGGDFISSELVHLSTGIDMVAAAINLALGIVPDIKPKHAAQGVAIRYFTPTPGKITNLIINDAIKSDPNLYQMELYRSVGDILPEIKSSLDRSGHIIATGENTQEAILNAEHALSRIEYKIEI